MKILRFWLIAILMAPAFLQGAYTLSGGKVVNQNVMPSMPPEEHYRLGLQAMERRNFHEAQKQFQIVSLNFSHLDCGKDALYHLGQCYYHAAEYELANKAFSEYIACQSNPDYFQEAIKCKFDIAEQFRDGARRHLFGTKKLPKWQTGRTIAIQIYDEVAAAVPNDELAVKSLYSKGSLLWSMKEYRDSIDAFHMLIRRFPKHELAPEAYLEINKVYLDLAKLEFGNPDILVFAEMNLRRFKKDFPREDRIPEAEYDVLCIKEVYANGLFQIGTFYERINKPSASLVYYHKAVQEFPDTSIAKCCRKRIQILRPKYAPEMDKGKLETSTT